MKNKKIVKCVNLSSISISANDFEADVKVGLTYYVKKPLKVFLKESNMWMTTRWMYLPTYVFDVPTYLCVYLSIYHAA